MFKQSVLILNKYKRGCFVLVKKFMAYKYYSSTNPLINIAAKLREIEMEFVIIPR